MMFTRLELKDHLNVQQIKLNAQKTKKISLL